MTIPAWFWPPSGAVARGVALLAFGGGLVVPDWTLPLLWPFAGGALANPTIVGTGSIGFGSAAPDTSGGVYATTWDGAAYHVTSGLAAVLQSVLPSGKVYVGTAYVAGSGFALAASGQVYNVATSGLLGTFPLPARPLQASGTTLAALMAASGVGLMNANTGATGLIALPGGMTTMSCLAMASGAPLVVGGWATTPALSGMAASALDPQNPLTMLAVGSGRAIVWSAPAAYADAWSQSQLVTGLANLTSLCWRPDGTQALACSPSSGVVQVLASTVGVISLAQTLTVSGAAGVAVTGDSVHALVAQSGLAQALPLAYAGSTWSSGAAVTGLTGIAGIIPYGASGAAAAVSSGVRYLNEVAGAWSLGALVALGFAPSVLTSDQFGQIYVAGSGSVALVSGATMTASGSWSGGTPTAIAVQQGRIVMAVPGDGLLRVFGLSAPGVLSQQYSGSLALGSPVGLGLSYTTLFVTGSGSTPTYGFSGTPYALTPVLSGSVGFWNGSSWSTYGLGVGQLPSAIGIGFSGDAWISTKQNGLFHLSSGAALIATGIVTQYTGQPQTVPLSPSAINVNSSGVFVATSIPGVLIQAA